MQSNKCEGMLRAMEDQHRCMVASEAELRAVAQTFDAENKSLRAEVERLRTPPAPLTEAEAQRWAEDYTTTSGGKAGEVAAMLLRSNRGDIPPEVRATDDLPPLGVVEDRTTAQLVADGDWRPTVGARVATAPFVDRPSPRVGTGEIVRVCGERGFVVRHDDGDTVHYDADELRPDTGERK